MSADNYLLIRRHPLGGYGIVMGFASDDEVPEVNPATGQYDALETAIKAAMREMDETIVEYGIKLHPECDDEDEVGGDA